MFSLQNEEIFSELCHIEVEIENFSNKNGRNKLTGLWARPCH